MSKNTGNTQKIIAGMMAVVFLFFVVVKLSHHCADEAHVPSAGIEQMDSNSKCAICDYHFTKDMLLPSIMSVTHSNVYPSSPDYFYSSIGTSSSIGLSYADRGPPSHS